MPKNTMKEDDNELFINEPQGDYQLTITLKRLIHKDRQHIGIYFPFNAALSEIAKNLDGVKWSQTHKCLYIANNPENLKKIFEVFRGKVWIDTTHLFEKSKIENNLAEKKKTVKKVILNHGLNSEISDKIKEFTLWLKSKRYSESTIKTYIGSLTSFFRFYHLKNVEEITNDDITRFNNEYILENNYSATVQNQLVNALKLFYQTIEKRKLFPDELDRPKRAKKLPNVISRDEVEKILQVCENIKHQAALSLIYCCGLRRSELLNLRLTDVDSKRNVLLIREAKGKKDRIAGLPDELIDLLRDYYKKYKPKVWLFEGWKQGEKYSAKSLENILKKAIYLARIKRPVTLHWLRHSFATHSLEMGTDLRFIQEILGHKSSKTTEIYTHVSTKSLMKIKSPFEGMKLKKK